MREKNWGKVRDLETFEALAPGIQKRNVFGPDTGWNDYVMRHFILFRRNCHPPPLPRLGSSGIIAGGTRRSCGGRGALRP